MASQAKCDQIVALKNAGIENKNIIISLMYRVRLYIMCEKIIRILVYTTSCKQIPDRPRNSRTGKLVKAIQKEHEKNC